MAPSTMKAIKSVENGKAEIQDVSVPKLKDDYLLVKVNAVALNPTDWKHIDFLANPGATVGCDFAGVVEDIGPNPSKSWKKGDRVAGFCHGVNSENTEYGAFGQYCLAKSGVQLKIPDNLSDEQAATLGVGISTVGQGLYQSLQLPLPLPGKGGDAGNMPLLVYGGSTATGSLAIQYGKLSGCKVITTCSPRNFDFVKKLGASEAFDYNDPQCGEKIREYTSNKLAHAFDCISEENSSKICCDAISSDGGAITYLLTIKHSRDDVKNNHVLAYTTMGEAFKFRGNVEFPAKPEDYEFGKKFWDLSTELLASAKINVHPPKVEGGGMAGIFDGLKQLKEGKVSGSKLVYKIE